MQIVNLFDDEANFDRLRACRSEQEVLDLIKTPPRRLFKRNTIMSLPMLQVASTTKRWPALMKQPV